MLRIRNWHRGVGFLVLLFIFGATITCQRRRTVEMEESLEPPGPAPEAARPLAEEEELILDPATDDLEAPFAGLRVSVVGAPWGESDRFVVLFHGYGAQGDDLGTLATRLNARVQATYLLPEAPFSRPRGGRAWFRRDKQNFDQGMSYARVILEQIGREKAEATLVVGGFSQGAMLTANLLATLPPGAVGALIFSPADYLTTMPTADSRRVRVFLSHGTLDPILAYSQGVALKDRLATLGFELTFVQFEGGHQIPPLVVDGAARFLEEVF